jgi:hypothetical protein
MGRSKTTPRSAKHSQELQLQLRLLRQRCYNAPALLILICIRGAAGSQQLCCHGVLK